MSDPMRMQGGMPPSSGMAGARSLLNPMDATMMAQKGEIQEGMTIGDLLNTLGLSPEDPVERLAEVTKQQRTNATMPGKMQSMAGRRMPQGAPSALEQGGGLDGLMNRMNRP